MCHGMCASVKERSREASVEFGSGDVTAVASFIYMNSQSQKANFLSKMRHLKKKIDSSAFPNRGTRWSRSWGGTTSQRLCLEPLCP